MLQKNIITLTTDFGTKDGYVAQMKGVILALNPEATIVDISHEVTSHDLLEAAFLIGSVYKYFPRFTLHLVVVDPGVGTKRKPILAMTENYFLMGPDNGVFSFVYEADVVSQVLEINATHYFRADPAQTFHGRDIFAPCAAWFTKGTRAEDFGEPLKNYTKLGLPKPQFAERAVKGLVIHIDKFGNIITNIPLVDLHALMKRAGATGVRVQLMGKEIPGLARNYAEAGQGVVALAGSQGFLEIAAKEKPAHTLLGAKRGAEVIVQVA